jgi:hemin uptake protein HemP
MDKLISVLVSPIPGSHKTVAIAHNGMLYTLQATKMGKLILTK